ncbi:MAG: exosortase C-terminal domain/associated protein EpsI [Candidatus Brocadiales bacterium]
MFRIPYFGGFSVFLISLTLLGLTTIGTFLISLRGEVVVTEKRLNTLPYTIDKWTGGDRQFESLIYEVLDTDDNLFRHYDSADNNPLWLYIGYYGTKKGGFTGHVPKYCYTGAGWEIVEMNDVDIHWKSRNTNVQVKKLLLRRENAQEVVLFWFHSAGDKVLDYGPRLKINKFWGKITTNRADGAFVRISATVLSDVDETLEYEKAFASRLLEYLPQCWPVEENAS